MWNTFLWGLKRWKDICQVSDDSSSTPVTAYRGNLMLKPCDVTRSNQPVTKTIQSIKHSENEESYTWEEIMPRKQIWRTSVVLLYCLAVKLTLWTESWIIKKNYSIWLCLYGHKTRGWWTLLSHIWCIYYYRNLPLEKPCV